MSVFKVFEIEEFNKKIKNELTAEEFKSLFLKKNIRDKIEFKKKINDINPIIEEKKRMMNLEKK